MEINIEDDFKEICIQILAEGKSEAEWDESPACDWFQTERFVGGFESPEKAFTFSYFDEQKQEFWFTLTLEEVNDIVESKKHTLEVRNADR